VSRGLGISFGLGGDRRLSLASVMTARVVAIELPIMRGRLRGGSLKNWESVAMLSTL
jgi:hypothetical protein